MTTILLILIPLCCFISIALCIHTATTKEFNPLFFTLDKEVQESEKRGVKPIIQPYRTPLKHTLMWILDWAILIGAVSFVVYLVLNAID